MQEISKITRKELRDFGILTGAIFAILFGLILPWLKGHAIPAWPWIVAAILWFLALLTPVTLKPVYQGWMRIGEVLGWINTRIILGIVFYLMVTPMGMLMHLFTKKDPMERKVNPNQITYRASSEAKNRLSMEKPY
jgi:hypothetical protein